VELQRFLLIRAVFRIEAAGVEGGIEVARIGVGVAVHRGARTVQGALNVVDADQVLLWRGRFAAWEADQRRADLAGHGSERLNPVAGRGDPPAGTMGSRSHETILRRMGLMSRP